MQWKKSSPALVELFSSVVPGEPAERRQMFGYPAAFVNGHLFMSLYQEDFILRLPDDARAKMLKIKGARRFEPMPGKAMKEYVVAPASVVKDEAALRKWIGQALEYAQSLPPKRKKAKSSRARRG
jgi:TfoX/Sxy family transcriptional regulator of competence genes